MVGREVNVPQDEAKSVNHTVDGWRAYDLETSSPISIMKIAQHPPISNEWTGIDRVSLLAANRKLSVFLLFVVLLVGGFRFSDGSLLLAISQGAGLEHPVLASPFGQYLFDSPLKVFVLRLLPANIVVIALFFLVLAVLPMLCVLFCRGAMLSSAWAMVFLTPSLKVSIQNVGVGDGLVLMLSCCLVVARDRILRALLVFIVALWHPQQATIILASFVIALIAYREHIEMLDTLVMLVSLALAWLVFAWFKSSLGFAYSGRLDFMLERAGQMLATNLPFVPLAIFPALVWVLAVKFDFGRAIYLVVWTLCLVALALLTTDVTRVITLVTLPIVLVSIRNNGAQSRAASSAVFLCIAVVVALFPVFSWSGFDYFLWNDLVRDLCKYRVYCLSRFS